MLFDTRSWKVCPPSDLLCFKPVGESYRENNHHLLSTLGDRTHGIYLPFYSGTYLPAWLGAPQHKPATHKMNKVDTCTCSSPCLSRYSIFFFYSVKSCMAGLMALVYYAPSLEYDSLTMFSLWVILPLEEQRGGKPPPPPSTTCTCSFRAHPIQREASKHPYPALL